MPSRGRMFADHEVVPADRTPSHEESAASAVVAGPHRPLQTGPQPRGVVPAPAGQPRPPLSSREVRQCAQGRVGRGGRASRSATRVSIASHPPETATPTAEFTQRLTSTRRGARLARTRHLAPGALHQLDAWGIPYGSDVSGAAAQIVAELPRRS